MQSSPSFNAQRYMQQKIDQARNAANSFIGVSDAKPVNRFASPESRYASQGEGTDDGEYKMFSRQELLDMKNGTKRGSPLMNSLFFSLGNGSVDQIIMMFQLYIALIAAVSRLSMDAAGMGASFLFGSQTLQNIFSIFLENTLNIILNTDVSKLTPEQLRVLLLENQPKLQKISAILIQEFSTLAIGLSGVFSKIANDWITNILPGLVKSAAIGIPSALEAAIPPLGEIVEIVNAGVAVMGAIVKVVNGFQSNYGNFKEAHGLVSGAFRGMQQIKDMFNQPLGEIVANAATDPNITRRADAAVDRMIKPNPFFAPPDSPSATPLNTNANPVPFSTGNGNNPNIFQKASDAYNGAKRLGAMGMYGVNRLGATAAETAASMSSRFSKEINPYSNPDTTAGILGTAASKLASKAANKFTDFATKRNTASGHGGGKGGYIKKCKSNTCKKKYKNEKQLKKYMSNLRRKTARKERNLLKSIRELKKLTLTTDHTT